MKKPTITITEEEYRDLCWSADTLNWLQRRGLCWRGADAVSPGWIIGVGTEWHYGLSADVRDLVDAHRALLANNRSQPHAEDNA